VSFVAILLGKSVISAALYLTTTARINTDGVEVNVLPTERYVPPEVMGLKYGTVRVDGTKLLHTYGAKSLEVQENPLGQHLCPNSPAANVISSVVYVYSVSSEQAL